MLSMIDNKVICRRKGYNISSNDQLNINMERFNIF